MKGQFHLGKKNPKQSHKCHVTYTGNYEALMGIDQLLKPRSETKD